MQKQWTGVKQEKPRAEEMDLRQKACCATACRRQVLRGGHPVHGPSKPLAGYPTPAALPLKDWSSKTMEVLFFFAYN